ncbi:Protein CBG20233 [Caenorhabditis briggsae]|uniref:Protein CBG20233 n=1 Tax=Caenorhabditis briggsae TaxID=6238 RepID=A8XXC9_CAEBR|nr:Protein CBG20233 [Caenorhabditis briggsae]CAP37298.2 Protein CBG20233 [Caenorhabditis briggsae]
MLVPSFSLDLQKPDNPIRNLFPPSTPAEFISFRHCVFWRNSEDVERLLKTTNYTSGPGNMRLYRALVCLFYFLAQALPSLQNRIYEKVYVSSKPAGPTERYDRFIRNGLFDFRPVIRHPYEYRLQ